MSHSGLPDAADVFFEASAHGDVATLRRLLEDDATLVHRRTPDGSTSLHLAVQHPDALRLLIEPAADANARDVGAGGPTMTGQHVASVVVALLLMTAGANAQSPDSSAASPIAPPTAPRLQNGADLLDELTEQYPLRLRNAAIGGTARVRLRVTVQGDVDSTWVAFSSGLPGLDRAALATVKKAKFEPATMNGVATAVWTELPLTFRTGEERGPEPQAIQVINRTELEAALPELMPETMREARIGARVGLDVTGSRCRSTSARSEFA